MTPRRKKLEDLLRSKAGPELEFKGAAAVEDEQILPRSVCSFLNARGGTILVGVKDDRSVEGIANPESAKRRVEDRLVSTVAPRADVAIEVENSPVGDRALLRITVPAGAPGTLHAVNSTRGRFLVPVRQGDRTVTLGWLEIQRKLCGKDDRATAKQSDEEIRGRLDGWVSRCEEKSSVLKERGGLYLVLRAELDSKVPDLGQRLEAALADPPRIGVGSGEGSFSDGRAEVRLGRSVLMSGYESEGYRWLEVTTGDDWELRFATRLDDTWAWGQSLAEQRKSRLIHPYALSQTVSSCVALSAALIRGHTTSGAMIHGALELRHLRGRVLPPGPPAHFGYLEMPSWPKITEDPGPAIQSMKVESFEERPHAFAKLLLDALYSGFGWDASKVPFYDAAQSRFVYR